MSKVLQNNHSSKTNFWYYLYSACIQSFAISTSIVRIDLVLNIGWNLFKVIYKLGITKHDKHRDRLNGMLAFSFVHSYENVIMRHGWCVDNIRLYLSRGEVPPYLWCLNAAPQPLTRPVRRAAPGYDWNSCQPPPAYKN